MKRILLALCICYMMFLSSCSSQESNVLSESENESVSAWYTGYSQIYLNDSGVFFLRNDPFSGGEQLYFYDYQSTAFVPLCNKPECSHKAVDVTTSKALCNAQICTTAFVEYQNRIYYIGTTEMNLSLCVRDIDGENDKMIAKLDASYMGARFWIYDNTAFVTAATSVSDSFSPETHSSNQSEKILFAVDIKSGKVTELARSPLASSPNTFVAYHFEKGIVSFYDEFLDEWFIYNIQTQAYESDSKMNELMPDISFDGYSSDGDLAMAFVGDYIYCLGNFETEIVLISLKTGERQVIDITKRDISGYCELKDYGLIFMEMDGDGNQEMYLFDYDHGNLLNISGCELNRSDTFVYISGRKNGLVYQFFNQDTEMFEYRYVTIENILDGSDEYQFICNSD